MLKNLEKIHLKVRPTVESFFTRVLETFDSRLDSIYLYGSVVTEDFIPGRSDVNSMVLFQNFDPQMPHTMRTLMPEGLKKHIIAPLSLAVETFLQSGDTFPLEFIEIRDKHIQIFGDADRVLELHIPREGLRVKIEEQIKGKLIRMQQFYMEHTDPPRRLMEVLLEIQRALFPVFRNFLRFLGLESPPIAKNQILQELENRTQCSLQSYKRLWDHARGLTEIPPDETEKVYNDTLAILHHLAKLIDGMERS